MRGWGWRGAVCALLVASGCTLFRAPQPPPIVNGVQFGIASWYGPGFHGRRTANGEIYDQYELTAAHQTLPLGTRVMVTSRTNGRSVDGRIIDLSYAAARVIGMIAPGTMPVRLEVLGEPVEAAPRPAIAAAAPRPA